MPRPKKPNGTTRLNLEMTEPVREALESLQKETDADSLAQVLRRSLAVYQYLWLEKQKGAELYIRGPGKKPPRELVLL